MHVQFVAQLLSKPFLSYIKNSTIFSLSGKMNGLHLREKFSSCMAKIDDSINITSPIFISRHTKGHIGIHLEGRIKPDTRLNIRFTPGPNVLAIKLDWTLSGAILYFQIKKDPHQRWTTNWHTKLATIRTTWKNSTFKSVHQVHHLSVPCNN